MANATLPSQLGMRAERRRALAPGARQTAQSHARSRRAFQRLQRGRPSVPVRSVHKRESPTARRRRRASVTRARARGRQFSRMPGTTTSEKSWMAQIPISE